MTQGYQAAEAPKNREGRRAIWGWAFYDFAESSFATTILVAVLPIYYLSIAPEGPIVFQVGPWRFTTAATSLWAYTVGVSSLLIAIPSPVLGAMADYGGRKKRYLAAFGYLGALFSGLLVLVGEGEYLLASALFLVANIGSVGGTTFYNALLLDVAPPGKLDRISGIGWAFGYVGGGTLLVINLVLITHPEWFGIPSAGWAARISFLTVGVWWAVFTVPTLLWVREKAPARRIGLGESLRAGFRRTWGTLRQVASYRDLALFVVAFLIYNDGIQTVIVMATPFGKETLGLSSGTLLGTLVLIQAIGVPGALFFGWLAERWGAKRAVMLSLVIWSGVVIYAWRMETAAEFWILGALVGLVLGGSQAISRSLYGAMVPADQAAEFYGFIAVSTRFASFFGPLVFGIVRDVTGSMRAGILALIAFFVVGLVLLSFVSVARAIAEGNRITADTAERMA